MPQYAGVKVVVVPVSFSGNATYWPLTLTNSQMAPGGMIAPQMPVTISQFERSLP
jgi:hypothetical protein